MSYQKIIIVGRLGRDPEMRYSPTGDPVTSFSVATDRQHTGADGAKVKETVWFRVSVWGKQAESCNQYLAKGKQVLVEGRLVADDKGGPRVYEAGGEKRASFEINADTVRFLSPRDEGTAFVDADSVPF